MIISLGWFFAGLSTLALALMVLFFGYALHLVGAAVKKLQERVDILEGKDPAHRAVSDWLGRKEKDEP